MPFLRQARQVRGTRGWRLPSDRDSPGCSFLACNQNLLPKSSARCKDCRRPLSQSEAPQYQVNPKCRFELQLSIQGHLLSSTHHHPVNPPRRRLHHLSAPLLDFLHHLSRAPGLLDEMLATSAVRSAPLRTAARTIVRRTTTVSPLVHTSPL